MCGIAGAVVTVPGALPSARLRAAGERLHHRGPDDFGYWAWDGQARPTAGRDEAIGNGAHVALVHRRLSILDLSTAGWQPMSSPDGRYHMAFNGEIYNFRELRSELEAEGFRFRSTGDTEVLLAAWAHWGRGCLPKLVGMFAFAVVDTQARRLTLVRDFFGIKPLYYCRFHGGLAFASEIKAVLSLTKQRPRPHAARLFDYLQFGMCEHAPTSMFDGIMRLPAAHLLEVPLAAPVQATPQRYWDIDLERHAGLSFEAASERLRDLFLDSVRLHLRSDVRVGAALSGGIDSSAIVSAIRHLQPNMDIHAVGYVADDLAVNEERHMRTVADAKHATLHRAHASSIDLRADLEHLIKIQDEPFGSTSPYAQHRVFRVARAKGIKVMLDGQGADELFAGYRPYLIPRLVASVRQGRLDETAGLLARARRHLNMTDRRLASECAQYVVPRRLERALRQALGKPLRSDCLNMAWFHARGIELERPFARVDSQLALRHTLYRDTMTTSVPNLLRYEDRNSMAVSVESRVPFLTPQLAEFAFTLPEAYLLASDGTSKSILRHALRGLVPNAILRRKDKIGFQTPEKAWLMQLSGWVDDTLQSDTARALPCLNLGNVRAQWRAIQIGSLPFDWRVWRWINAIRWIELHDMQLDA